MKTKKIDSKKLKSDLEKFKNIYEGSDFWATTEIEDLELPNVPRKSVVKFCDSPRAQKICSITAQDGFWWDGCLVFRLPKGSNELAPDRDDRPDSKYVDWINDIAKDCNQSARIVAQNGNQIMIDSDSGRVVIQKKYWQTVNKYADGKIGGLFVNEGCSCLKINDSDGKMLALIMGMRDTIGRNNWADEKIANEKLALETEFEKPESTTVDFKKDRKDVLVRLTSNCGAVNCWELKKDRNGWTLKMDSDISIPVDNLPRAKKFVKAMAPYLSTDGYGCLGFSLRGAK